MTDDWETEERNLFKKAWKELGDHFLAQSERRRRALISFLLETSHDAFWDWAADLKQDQTRKEYRTLVNAGVQDRKRKSI